MKKEIKKNKIRVVTYVDKKTYDRILEKISLLDSNESAVVRLLLKKAMGNEYEI